MKNILLLTALMTVISCTHHNRKVTLAFNIDTPISNVGNGKGIELSVFDDRANRRYLGYKIFGGQKVRLSADQNVAELLKKKLTDNLMLKGFETGSDKIVEVHLRLLKFKAQRGVPIGHSSAKIVVRLIVTDFASGEAFAKDYTLGLTNDHFIASLKSSDEQVINELLRELVRDILEDDVLLESLGA